VAYLFKFYSGTGPSYLTDLLGQRPVGAVGAGIIACQELIPTMVTYPALDLNIFYSFKTSAFTTELSRYPATYRAHATYYDTRGHIGESHRDKMIVFPTTE